ncbi:MAG: type VI secretion system tip protein VgrG [Planctomycetes bacterium]|nr:type VI secretion system tip protein VgrG [Planctomycetota bacterium]
MTALTNQSIEFEVEGLAKNTLVVTKLVGKEALSELWRFELQLVSRDKELDLEQVLYAPVRLGLKQGLNIGGETALRTHWFDGLLTEFKQRQSGQGWVKYAATMVPKLWLAKAFSRSQILLDHSVGKLITTVLTGEPGLTQGEDFELSLERESPTGTEDPYPERWREVYPAHEYVAQYQESDFAFLSRWLEHEGVFYLFDNDGEREQVRFVDSNAAYVDSRATLPYRPSTTEGSEEGGENTLYDAEVVRSFGCDARRRPKRVLLNDYNWRTPEVELSVAPEAKDTGVGLKAQYGQHFRTDEQGKALAAVRCEELLCRQAVFEAESNCKSLRPGKTFKLVEHYRDSFNSTYLVIGVTHRADQSVDFDGGTVSSSSYGNTLTLIPGDVTFRPRRTTEWPTIKGVMHAKVDAVDSDGDYAEVDEHGRYRIRFPFDYGLDSNNPEKRSSGQSSRYVRMMQPYAGPPAPGGERVGFHFPLHKDTDVLIVHLDGHPDRPVIAGAVPNPDTLSPVSSANYMQNMIVTASGNTLGYDDNPERPGIFRFDAARSVVEDSRFAIPKGSSSESASSPGAGSGGVVPAPAAPAPQTPGRPAARTTADEPGAGTGAVVDEAPAPTVPTPWEEFTGGKAFGQEGDLSALQSKAGQLLRKHRSFGGGGSGATLGLNTMAALRANLASEPLSADPASPSPPDGPGGALDAYLDWIKDNGAQCYTAAPETFSVRVGDHALVKLGTVAYTFNDVSNSIDIGTGGYGYNLNAGDSFSETYYEGKNFEVSRFRGDVETYTEFHGSTKSDSLEFSTNDNKSIRLGATSDMGIFVGAEDSMALELSGKNSMSLTVGLSSEIDIFVGGKMTVDIHALPGLEITIGPSNVEIEIPVNTEIKLQDLKVALDETNVKLNNTSTNMMKTNVALSETKTALAKTQTELSETKAQLAQTEQKLSQTTTELSETKTALSDQVTALSQTQSLLSNDVQCLAFTRRAGISSI